MKNLISTRSLILYALFCLCSFTATSQSCYNIVGYVVSWQGDNAALDYSKYTHLNYAFAIPNSNGTIGAIDNASKLSDLVSRGHATNTKVLLSVGGWLTSSPDNTPYDAIAQNSTSINNFVNACANLVTQYNLDGIDIDWEYPNSQTNWNNIMNPLATRIHGMGKLLTAAVPANSYAGDRVGNLSILDLVNIMSYDCNCPSNSPYNEAVADLSYWAGRGVPVAKRILGVPFYSSDNYTALHVQKANYVKAGNGGGIMIWEITSPGDINAIASTLGTLCKGTVQPTCTTINLPATIQAEAYCDMAGVQLESTTDAGGGQNVGYIDANDWMHYKVNAPSTGTYTVQYRVASLSGGGSIRLEPYGGGTAYGTVTLPSTGGWQTWTTVSQTITLTAGVRDIAVVAVTGGFNLNWINISPSSSNTFSTTIQAESYTSMSGVQLETTTDTGGGQNVGYIDANDWMVYTAVNIPSAGTYTVQYRVASQSGGGNIQLERAGGSAVFGSIAVPSTGGWQTWTTISQNVTLPAGSVSFGIKAIAGGFNLNWFSVKTPGTREATEIPVEVNENIVVAYPNPTTGRTTIAVNLPTAGHTNISVSGILGERVAQLHDGHLEAGTHEFEFNGENLSPGLYTYSVIHNGVRVTKKLLIKQQ
jgi:chitinase